MKKYVALILAVMMMLSLATGCGQAGTAPNEGSTQAQTTQPSTAGEDKPAEAAPAEAPSGGRGAGQGQGLHRHRPRRPA